MTKLFITQFLDGSENISGVGWGHEGFMRIPGEAIHWAAKIDSIERLTVDISREEWLRNIRANHPDPWKLIRCIDCDCCDPLCLIGQTAVCRWCRAKGLDRGGKIDDPYLFIYCEHYRDIIKGIEKDFPVRGELKGQR